MGQLKLKKPKTLEELTPLDHELCQVFASLGAVLNTAQLIKHEINSSDLKGYIGTCFPSFSLLGISVISFLCLCLLLAYYDSCRIISHVCLGAGMVLNEEKSKRLAEVIARRAGALDDAGGSAPSALLATVPLATTPASPIPAPAKKDKEVVAIESDDEDTGEGLVFKRQRVVVVATSHSATDSRPASFRDHSHSASSPACSSRSKVVGRAPPEMTKCRPLLSYPLLSSMPSRASKRKEQRRLWMKI